MNDLISNDVMAHEAKKSGHFRIALCACLYAGDWERGGAARRGRRGRKHWQEEGGERKGEVGKREKGALGEGRESAVCVCGGRGGVVPDQAGNRWRQVLNEM